MWNKKTKKIFLSSLTLSSIILPLSFVIACGGKTIKNETTTRDSDAFTDANDRHLTVGAIVDHQKATETSEVQSELLNEVKELTAETLYKQEATFSIAAQIEDFNYQKIENINKQWETAKEIWTLKPSTMPAYKGTTIAAKESEIADAVAIAENSANSSIASMSLKLENIKQWKEDNKKIYEKITKASDSGFGQSDFVASDYPMVLTRLDKVKETQQKNYNEAKESFVSSASTRSEGEVAWESQRENNYNGAKTDDEAVNYLINGAISSTAFGRYTYSIESTNFTVKKVKSGVFTQFEKDAATGNYKFDGTYGYFAKDEDDDSKVYFLSRSTYESSKRVVRIDATNTNDLTTKALKRFADKNVIEVQHTLIDIKNATGYTLPWTVTKDTIKKLLSTITNNGQANSVKSVFDMYENMFLDPLQVEKDDKWFLANFSNNEESTKDKAGNLGINQLSYWVKSMDSSFGMGIVAAEAIANSSTINVGSKDTLGYAKDATAGKDILAAIQTNLETELNKGTSDSWKNATSAEMKNTIMEQYIDGLKDDDFNKTYGGIFRDAFFNQDLNVINQNKSQLVFPIDESNHVYIVRSQFGIHTIKITNLGQPAEIQKKIKTDFENMAKNDDTSAASVVWSDVFKTVFTDQDIVADLLENQDVETEWSFDNDFETRYNDKFNKWVDQKYIKTGEKVKDVVLKTIANIQKNDVISTAVEALTGKTDYLNTQMDSHYLNDTVLPEDLYNAALVEMGATK